MVIRPVKLDDSNAITAIYNHYVVNSVITFETTPVEVDEMRSRICKIAKEYPYFVCELDGGVVGYCYAHRWKEKAAYNYTAETTIYLSPQHFGKGIGVELMHTLIKECRGVGFHALIACITQGNYVSNALHEKLGFKQVSTFVQVGSKFGNWLDVIDYELLLK